MQFSYEGKEYDIRFYYDWVSSPATLKAVRQTRCTISSIDPLLVGQDRYRLMVEGVAVQHVNDQFCRRIGRKIALRKAIDLFTKRYVKYDHGTTANKMVRKRIWDAYFVSCDFNMLPVNKKELKAKRYADEISKGADIYVNYENTEIHAE